MDADTDALPRSDILDLTTKFNQLIAMRGVADGVCDLDGSGKVPTTRLEAKLAAIAGLVGAADKGLHFTGIGTAAVHTQTAFARTLLDDANQAAALATLGAVFNTVVAQAAAYTVAVGDRGKLFDCSGTFTLTLTAAATLGGGFAFAVRNSGTGTITVDPNATETIDGAATIALAAGESTIVVCDGAAFRTVGRSGAVNGAFRSKQIFTASGTYTKPTGLVRLKLTAVGGGGGGGTGSTSGGSGGGGGGATVRFIEAASIGATETVTVGAGGTGGTASAATAGGTSSFGTLASATGGGLGGFSGAAPGDGGLGSGGEVNVGGGGGGSGSAGGGGSGGGSLFGGGGRASVGAAAANTGRAYGGGGGGGGTDAAGAAGAAGVVIIEEFF